MINEKNIYEKGMLVAVTAGTYAGRMKLSEEQLKNFPDIVRGVFDLFDLEYKKKLAAINALDLTARTWIKKKLSIPFPIDGFYFVVSAKLDEAIAYLDEKKVQRQELIQGVLDDYDEAIKIFAEKYPEYYEHAKNAYPTKAALQNRFHFNYYMIKMAPPDKDDSIISPEQYKKEMIKFKESIEDMKKEVAGTIYEALLDSTDQLRKQCTDGKPNQRTLDSLNKFLKQIDEVYAGFIDRNDLKNVIKKIKAQVLGITAEELRDRDDLKDKFGKAIKDLAVEIKALPDIPLKRAIEF